MDIFLYAAIFVVVIAELWFGFIWTFIKKNKSSEETKDQTDE